MSITVTTHHHNHVAEIRFARPPLNFVCAGLVDRRADPDTVIEKAHHMAGKIAANGPMAVLATRQTWLGGLIDDVSTAMAQEHARQSELRTTADFAEGVAAVFERRPANFTGQ